MRSQRVRLKRSDRMILADCELLRIWPKQKEKRHKARLRVVRLPGRIMRLIGGRVSERADERKIREAHIHAEIKSHDRNWCERI